MKEGYNHMEFIVKTDLNSLPKTIDFNFEEMKAEFSKKLVHYNTLVVTEDSIRDAKADKAALNKLKEAIETRRKEIKKLCLAPYENFEKQCKELVAMIEAPVKSIDGQIAVFDQKLQDEKWKQISEYYNTEVKELKDLVPLEKIVSSKWKNKGESLESVNNGIGDTLERIRGELETISTLHSPYEQQIKDVYLNDFNLSKALMEQKRLEERQKQIEEMEAKKAAQQQTVIKSAPQPTAPPVVETPAASEPPTHSEPLYSATFKVSGTQTQLQALAAFMKKYNINYEVIK